MAESAAEVELHEDSAYQLLSGTQKCAIVMLLLGEDEAAEILKNLSKLLNDVRTFFQEKSKDFS